MTFYTWKTMKQKFWNEKILLKLRAYGLNRFDVNEEKISNAEDRVFPE